jgi:isoleucyl-tRNA synthetase
VRTAFDAGEPFRLDADGEVVELDADDVELRAAAHEEFALAQDGALAVALDVRVDADLRREGLARDLVRLLNDHRKKIGLEIADRVELGLTTRGEVLAAARHHHEWIAAEVLATSVTVGDLPLDGGHVDDARADAAAADGDVTRHYELDGEPLDVVMLRA